MAAPTYTQDQINSALQTTIKNNPNVGYGDLLNAAGAYGVDRAQLNSSLAAIDAPAYLTNFDQYAGVGAEGMKWTYNPKSGQNDAITGFATSDTAAPSPAATPATSQDFGPTSYEATTRQVDPNELASTRLSGLIAQNSPYLQQARAGAMIGANDRGLVNSSIAQGSAQMAAINAALPIANADASTTNNVLSANMAAQNAASQTNAQLAASLKATSMNNATALQQTGMSTATQMAVAKMSASSQAAISAAHDANSVLLANSGAAMQAFNQYLTNVGNIDANPNMDEKAKQTAIQTQTDIFNGAVKGLRSSTAGVPDVSSALDFSKPAAATTTATTGADAVTAAVYNNLYVDGSS